MKHKLSKTTEQFIIDAQKVHSDKYDYSKVNYKNNKTKICIICPEHGEFWQLPAVHLKGSGCQKCSIICQSKKLKKTTEQFINEARKIHSNKYNYSKVDYINNCTKVCIICPEHGEFWQAPNKHLDGTGCYECFKERQSKNKTFTLEQFIENVKKVHGDKYDYSKTKYTGLRNKICIICPEHGEFWQTAGDHLNGCGCQECGKKIMWDNRGRITTEEFIERAKKIHGDEYNYSKVNYVNSLTLVSIICSKHGEFKQLPPYHLIGCGCPNCANSKLNNEIALFLEKNHIKFIREKKFDWLIYIDKMRLDFYLPDYNIAIECQGEQHYIPVDFAGRGKEWAEENFKLTLDRDKKKKELCQKHGIKLIYYENGTTNDPQNINNKEELLKEIKSYE